MLQRVFLFFLLLSLFFQTPLFCQTPKLDSLEKKAQSALDYLWNRDHDPNYIKNYSDQLSVKLLGVNKLTFFQIRDRNLRTVMGYRPETGLNLGFGVAYQWFAVDMAFNVGIREETIPESNFIDFQAQIFSRMLMIEASLKYFYGYRVTRAKGFNTSDLGSAEVRPDIRTLRFGLQLYYTVDYNKYTLKAPLTFTEAQIKSAGSPILGVGFSSFSLGSDSSVVPSSVQNAFDSSLYLTDVTSLTLSISAGYSYTLVWGKNWFATVGAIPGLSINYGDSKVKYREQLDLYLSFVLRGIGSLGYNSKKWFAGIQIMPDLERIRIAENRAVLVGHAKSKIFFGYRFNVSKK